MLTGGLRAYRAGPGQEHDLTGGGSGWRAGKSRGIPARARARAFAPRWDAIPGQPWRQQRIFDRIAPHWRAEINVLHDDTGLAYGVADVELEVMRDDAAPYRWQGTSWVLLRALKQVSDPTGTVLPVYIDPDDPDRVAIAWHAAY